MKRTVYGNGVVAYAFKSFARLPLQAHISARHGGVSPSPWRSLNFSYGRGDERARVKENFSRFCAALGQDPRLAVRTRQVHGTRVSRVDWKHAGTRRDRCDALITAAVGLPLFLVFADCVPVVLYDARRHALGVCHSGWRGTVQGAARATLRAMEETFGARAGDVAAAIGPSIGPESYEVGEEVWTAAIAGLTDAGRYFRSPDGRGTGACFDLWRANADQLEEAGVERERIELAGIDTARTTHEFFSHRAEKGECGLFGLLAWLEPVDKPGPDAIRP